jgi:hypothetical protein
MTRGRQAAGWALALAMTVGLAALSRAEWRAHRGTSATLRLTWSARPERIETCRRLGAAELAERPVHMRQEVVCEGTTATYRLRVWRGDDLVEDAVLRGGGLRNDRPMYLLRDYDLPPGGHRLRVEVRRVEVNVEDTVAATADAGLSLDRSVREAEERQRRRLDAMPSVLELEDSFVLAAREVVLVTYDAETRRLRLVQPPPATAGPAGTPSPGRVPAASPR